MPDYVFSVSELNEAVSRHLSLLGEVVVEGEISQLQISQGRWLFLTIKDNNASVSIFAPVFKISGAKALEEGMQVQVFAKPGLYKKTGRFSLNAHRIIPAGEGALRLAYEKLKKQLREEGLFDEARKREIVRFPQRIGLITAKDSRAYGDFIKVLGERFGGAEVHFYPANVQGNDSVNSILKAFNYFNQSKQPYDALVMTRGGGSLEDLLSFNDEQVARAVFASKFPVVSGIGHEDDIALTDYVADLRASTPSNAAELLVPSRSQVKIELDHMQLKIERNLQDQINGWHEKINQSVQFLEGFFEGQKQRWQSLLNQFNHQVTSSIHQLGSIEDKTKSAVTRMSLALPRLVMKSTERVDYLQRILNSYDHDQVLKRGFSITKDKDGKVVRDAKQLVKGQVMITTLHKGKAESIIK